MSRVLDHHPERVAERRRDEQDREQLDEVREGRGVLEGVRRVDVEEAPTVRAELLDHDLRGGGPHGDDLLGELGLLGLGLTLLVQHRLALVVGHRFVVLDGLEDSRLLVGPEVLHHPLGDEGERTHERQGQQDVEGRAGEVHPEVADRLGGTASESPDQRDQRGHAGGRGDEVLDGETEHLGEVAHRRLATVALPVGVRGEAHRSVEGRVRGDGAEGLGVQGQHALHALQEVDDQQPHQVEEHHRDRVALPAHLDVGRDSADPIDQPLEPAEDALEGHAFALVDPRHVGPERLGEHQEHDDVECELHIPVGTHAKSSGFSRARTR